MYLQGNMKLQHIRTNKIKPKEKKLAPYLPFNEDTSTNLIERINKKFPIKLEAALLDKLCKQYPLISKSDVALIMKTSLEVMREHMIKSYKINIIHLFIEMHLSLIKYKDKYWFLKPKFSTSPTLRKR